MKIVHLVLVATMSLTLATACQNKKGPNASNALKTVHFDFDSATIRSDMAKILDGNAGYLKKHAQLKVLLEGNCDERGTNEYNLALGERRATTAKSYLTGKGISGSRLKTISYGEERPVAKGHNEAAWYQNRRVDFGK